MAASLGSVTKDRKQSGTAYLIEGQTTWVTVVVVGEDLLNVWVETSVLKKP